jgi:hypothetical protein
MLVMSATAVGATVGAAVLGSPGAALADAVSDAGGSTPSRSAFVPAIGSLFTARAGQTRHTLRLLEILDVPPVPNDEHAFNLIFEAASSRPVADAIYRLTSVRVPACEFFISAIEAPSGRPRLQALVNRRPA